MRRPILTVDAVEKQYKTVKAVDRISFEVGEGEIFALLGPNGAGKSTMVRMMMRIIAPDAGGIHYHLNVPEDQLLSQLGYLPEDRGLYQDMAILPTITYFGVLRGMPRAEAKREAQRWLEKMGLGDRGGEKLDALSKGNQQKVQFIASILHRPRFAILDEPFSGLDPINQNVMIELLQELRNQGTTVLLSAHQMELVESIADRLFLMNRGKQVLYGTMAELRERVGVGTNIEIGYRGETDIKTFETHPAVDAVQAPESGKLEIMLRPDAALGEFLAFTCRQVDLVTMQSREMSLHGIYLRAVKLAEEGHVAAAAQNKEAATVGV